jgi:hypothetical protein
MQLFLNGSVFTIAQLGPDFAILADAPKAHPAGTAEIEVTVDGAADRFSVKLPVGLAEGEKRIRFSPSSAL